MEKQFTELLAKVQAEFSGYIVEMGIAKYKAGNSYCWVNLKPTETECPTCHHSITDQDKFFTGSTWDEVLAAVRNELAPAEVAA